MYGVLWADEKYEDLQRCSFDTIIVFKSIIWCLSGGGFGTVVSGECMFTASCFFWFFFLWIGNTKWCPYHRLAYSRSFCFLPLSSVQYVPTQSPPRLQNPNRTICTIRHPNSSHIYSFLLLHTMSHNPRGLALPPTILRHTIWRSGSTRVKNSGAQPD